MADLTRLPGPNTDLWDWQLRSACRHADPDLFFHPEGERGPARESRDRAAKLVCATCPVLASCRSMRCGCASRTASGAACPRTTARRSTPSAPRIVVG